jgi:hypothetical protein
MRDAARTDSTNFWTISLIGTKLRGMGYLLKNQHGEPPPDGEEADLGIGEVLIELGRELGELEDEVGRLEP